MDPQCSSPSMIHGDLGDIISQALTSAADSLAGTPESKSNRKRCELPGCEKEFVPDRRTQRCCSRKHTQRLGSIRRTERRRKARGVQAPRVCANPECPLVPPVFTPTRPTKKHHSTKCGKRAYYLRHRTEAIAAQSQRYQLHRDEILARIKEPEQRAVRAAAQRNYRKLKPEKFQRYKQNAKSRKQKARAAEARAGGRGQAPSHRYRHHRCGIKEKAR